MASIFTYDPDPPRVSSPWLQPDEPDSRVGRRTTNSGNAKPCLLSDYGVTRLQAEPQEGPTEYKLHLLLRPRRAFKSMSTAGQSSAYQHRTPSASQSGSNTSTPVSEVSSRQSRLHHLTTQLLWRLQQSSPNHTASSKDLVIPRLLKAQLSAENQITPSALLPGLEESKGALYEIGVADDGALIGLTKDEMDESIMTLKIMAASLGCSVEILRSVIVGECEWSEGTELVDDGASTQTQVLKHGKLWVAEALVVPNIGLRNTDHRHSSGDGEASISPKIQPAGPATVPISMPNQGSSKTPQLRVTLTGPTTSGKSSLLGTLSTGTLDNGRGKSRLSLLKHRHEVVSGVTSSIAQEIVGYKDHNIMNFSQVNIESWTDIHDRAEEGRLVFVLDSGGHPRYRRTVLRGLMNWAPHWSILCIAADDTDSTAIVSGGTNMSEHATVDTPPYVDLVSAHLTLALKLNVPMAVVITKLDLASKAGLQKTVGKVLTAIKEAKRTPKIIQPDQKQHDHLQQIPRGDTDKVRTVIDNIVAGENLTDVVPILLTSAVRGIGIGLLHALLESLPLPPAPTAGDFVGMALNPEQPRSLFHIDDTFNLPTSYVNLAGDQSKYLDEGVVVSGYLRFGDVSVGDRIVVGPFPAETDFDDTPDTAPSDRASPGGYGLSMSHPSSAELARVAMKNAVSASAIVGQWHNALIVSLRNLRLPVRTLAAGQAGSVGLVLEAPSGNSAGSSPRIRRGMVLAIPSKHMADTGLSLQAASGFTATFSDPEAENLIQGSFVNVYFASVRATARIVTISRPLHAASSSTGNDEDEDIFNLGEMDGVQASAPVEELSGREVYLELQNSREWVELGSKVIILEGGSQDKSGLEGIVGKVIEIVD
ncbi:elongation factor tu GTP binding domain-containing protein [Sarocladium implicatum]|nr:elongation factor tu GTP binding domain-containing protein [Sarocladium implicatum]